MKRKILYGTFITFFVVMTVFIVAFRKKDVIPYFKERSQNISNAAEWQNAKTAIEKLLAELKVNPSNEKAKLNLGLAYIQESRITGNHGYYDQAALQLFDEIIEKNSENFQAWCGKGTVLLSQHHFTDALNAGMQAIRINPYNAYSYGILVDANVELGHYEKAVQMADKMVSIRPDLTSYSRISYLREIFGDYKGAIEAMNMAVEAGVPGFEQTEWSRVNLGHLKELNGDLQNAEMDYTLAAYNRPNYPFALAGMGRLEKANGNFEKAITLFEKAKGVIDDYSFSDELSSLYSLTNQPLKSRAAVNHAIELLSASNGSESASVHGHYADRELALLYVKSGDLNLALKHAQLEYDRRPDNIDINQTLAWVYYKRGEFKLAKEKIDIAVRTKSQNPILLYQAGLINLGYGNKQEGLSLMKKALEINPFLPAELKNESSNSLALK